MTLQPPSKYCKYKIDTIFCQKPYSKFNIDAFYYKKYFQTFSLKQKNHYYKIITFIALFKIWKEIFFLCLISCFIVYIFFFCNIVLIENGKLCPSFHKFIAECDKSTNCDDDIDIQKLDNIQTHFNQETSAFCTNNSEESDDAMVVDLIEPSSEITVHSDPGPSNQDNNQFDGPENLGRLYYCYISIFVKTLNW